MNTANERFASTNIATYVPAYGACGVRGKDISGVLNREESNFNSYYKLNCAKY